MATSNASQSIPDRPETARHTTQPGLFFGSVAPPNRSRAIAPFMAAAGRVEFGRHENTQRDGVDRLRLLRQFGPRAHLLRHASRAREEQERTSSKVSAAPCSATSPHSSNAA